MEDNSWIVSKAITGVRERAAYVILSNLELSLAAIKRGRKTVSCCKDLSLLDMETLIRA
jgi:hypothetical protein